MAHEQTHIVGCGDIGRRVALLYLERNKIVEAWVKSTASHQACQKIGLKTRCIDLDLPVELSLIRQNNLILYTVPPPP